MKIPLVPFVQGATDASLLSAVFADSPIVRLTSEAHDKGLGVGRSPESRLWLDTGFDVFGNGAAGLDGAWSTRLAGVKGARHLFEPAGRASALKSGVLIEVGREFLSGVHSKAADMLSVPQFPLVRGLDTLQANVRLAEMARDWDADSDFAGKWVLPVILMHYDQYSLKGSRVRIINSVRRCIEKSEADAVWVADSSLADQSGAENLQAGRIPALLKFHQELREALPDLRRIIAGPYWCFHLNLWCRGLITEIATGLGSAFQYRLSGGRRHSASERVALNPLRRWALATPNLKAWISDVLSNADVPDATKDEFAAIQRHVNASGKLGLRRQIARAYKKWVTELAAVPPTGRSLLLFQQLTAAYALGRTLPSLSAEEGPARRPERIAEQHMVNCL